MSGTEPTRIRENEELGPVLETPLAVVYKHSPYCGVSAMAVREVRRFMADHPDVPVYLVDVVRDRPVSQELERQLGVQHESPQAIVVRSGRPVWNASHSAVTAAAIEEATAA